MTAEQKQTLVDNVTCAAGEIDDASRHLAEARAECSRHEYALQAALRAHREAVRALAGHVVVEAE